MTQVTQLDGSTNFRNLQQYDKRVDVIFQDVDTFHKLGQYCW